MRAALSKIAAPRHKNNKWRLWRRLRSHTDGEIFHASHRLTFKWTAPALESTRAAAVRSSYQRSVQGSVTRLSLSVKLTTSVKLARDGVNCLSYSGKRSLSFNV